MPERDAAEVEQMATLAAVVDAAPRVTMVIEADGRIRWVSEAALALVGVAASELPGRSVLEFVDPQDQELVLQTIDYLLTSTGTFRPMEFRFARPDGSQGVLEAVSANRLDDPAIGGIVVQVHDVTERRITDEVLEVIAAGGGFDETLHLLAHLLEAQLGDARGIIGVDARGDRFRIAASRHDIVVDELTEEDRTEDVGLPWAEAIRTARPVIHSDLSTLSPALRADAESQGFAACWVFPVPAPATTDIIGGLIAWRTRPGRP